MSFRLFIYYCSLCGGCAAYVGWALGRLPRLEDRIAQTGLRGLFLGVMVALSLGLLDTLWNGSAAGNGEGLLRVLTAVAVGGLGGLLGGAFGQACYGRLEWRLFLILGW